MRAERSTWDDLPTDHPMPKVARRRVLGTNMMISHVTLSAGFEMPVHQHANEQIVVVVSGHLIIRSGAEQTEHVLRGGDVLVLPPDEPHDARAIEDTVVLDLFSPTSTTTGLDA